MPLDPSVVGRVGLPTTWQIEAGHVRNFADAIGDPSPVYRSEEAARAAGHPGIPVPPTMLAVLKPDESMREGLDMDWSRILHGGEEITVHVPLHVGDRVTVTPRISAVFTKEGRTGVMDFLVLQTEGRDEDGVLRYGIERTVIVKRRVP